jgi:microcompartment protein CcmL/EutN
MPKKELRSCLHDEISLSDAATLLHMDPRSVQRAVKAGTIQQSRRGCFILGKIIPAYVDHLRERIANNPDEAALRAAKLRKALADAERAELTRTFQGSTAHQRCRVIRVVHPDRSQSETVTGCAYTPGAALSRRD